MVARGECLEGSPGGEAVRIPAEWWHGIRNCAATALAVTRGEVMQFAGRTAVQNDIRLSSRQLTGCVVAAATGGGDADAAPACDAINACLLAAGAASRALCSIISLWSIFYAAPCIDVVLWTSVAWHVSRFLPLLNFIGRTHYVW